MLFHTRFLCAYRSHNHGATYFGKFIFTTDVNEVEITPTTIVVRRIADNSTQVAKLGGELFARLMVKGDVTGLRGDW